MFLRFLFLFDLFQRRKYPVCLFTNNHLIRVDISSSGTHEISCNESLSSEGTEVNECLRSPFFSFSDGNTYETHIYET